MIKSLSEDRAWELCESAGAPAPYPGFITRLGDGRGVLCIKVGGDNRLPMTNALHGGTVEFRLVLLVE